MHTAKIAERTGINAQPVQAEAAETARLAGRAIVIEDAVGRVNADHQIGLETFDLAVQPACFRFRHGDLAGVAARVALGLAGPVGVCVARPVRRRKIAVDINAAGIGALRRIGQQAIWIGQRNDPPVILPCFVFIEPLQPTEDD